MNEHGPSVANLNTSAAPVGIEQLLRRGKRAGQQGPLLPLQ